MSGRVESNSLRRGVLPEGGGLTSDEVDRRRSRFGFNEIPIKGPNPVFALLRYFWGPIPWMIEIAAGLALLVQHWDDVALILVLLCLNGIVGFWEERQAGNAVQALKAELAVRARVLRDGAWTVLPSRELVPGDRLRLRPGDVVPADVALAPGSELESNQSTLTGESLPVQKHPGETVYSSSLVVRGEADGTVIATGPKTFFGRTADLVESAHTVSHFQRAVLRIGNFLIVLALALACLIEVVSLVRGRDPVSTLQFALVMTVAAIPVALPTVLSVTMAVGARRMAREHAVVTRLSAMEELAGMDVLCSDKTGTLTENRLTMGEPFAVPGVTNAEVIRTAALASRIENRDPIDLAVLARADADELLRFTVTEYWPFDAERKVTEARVRDPSGAEFLVSKGACQVLLDRAKLNGDTRADVDRAIEEFAVHGYRTLAVARTDAGGAWQFLGILPLFDPLRADAPAVVHAAQELGVEVKILTGDQLAIGQETARRLGLGTQFLPAEAVRGPRSARREDSDSLRAVNGIAQVFPEDKFVIVQRLQEQGHIVGMTGDGVNDAPALKQADVGVAVSGATDVARGAASLVVLTAGLGVLVDAIRESRRIFARMNSYAVYRVGETVRILLFLTLAILAFDLYPVTAVMIILIAVLNDGAILAIAYDEAPVARAPVRWEMGRVLALAATLGGVGVAFSFVLLALALGPWALPFGVVQTMIYLKLSVAGHFGIFATRTQGAFWRSRPAPLLLVAVLGTQGLASLIAASGLILTALPLKWVGVVWGFSMVDLVVFDLAKRGVSLLIERRSSPLATRPSGPRESLSVRAWFYHRRFARTRSRRPPGEVE